MKSLTAFAVGIAIIGTSILGTRLIADENAKAEKTAGWTYDAGLMQPFWLGDTVDGESVLFIRDPATGEAKAQLLFPVEKILNVTRAVDWRIPGGMTFEEGRDYVVKAGSREISLPKDSRIPSFTTDQLRVPAGSQKYRLTHRDGNGEILFAAGAEYHEMQVCVSYRHANEPWPSAPRFNEKVLPKTIQKLKSKEAVSIVLLGDSISTGCNASGWANSSPHQPPYQDLLLEHLKQTYSPNVTLTNLAVGGTSTPWGLTRIPDVVAAKPDLVILAFGMNDSAGRSAEEYKSTTLAMIKAVRETQPQAEFILVASMLGNRDWVTLKHELFPQYRTALQELTEPGIALADMTSIWTEMLNRKQDWDLTGNGVNHPNDFGHRVYAQVLTTLLVAPNGAAAASTPLPEEPFPVRLWPDKAPNGDETFEVSEAKITVHLPKKPGGSAIVICPGGGYGGLVTGPEGHGIAKWLNSHGIAGIVLEYRLPAGRSFVPLLDAQRAMRIVRAHATEWHIHPGQVGIMGFSAGGHLASTAATHFDAGNPEATDPLDRPSSRPDFAVLVYPVVTMGEKTHGGSRTNLLGANPSQELMDQFSAEKNVTERTPPMFLTHAVDDGPVPNINSKTLFDALQTAKIPSKYLELPSGGHGLNGYQGPMWDAWQKQSMKWLVEQGVIRVVDAGN